MGRRGPGAKVRRGPLAETPAEPHRWPFPGLAPWEYPGMLRWERVVAFCEALPVTAGMLAGTAMRLRPWQREIIRDIYGETSPRRIKTAVLSMARKNGKTGLAAALCLCHLCGPEAEPRGQIFSAAADKNQAAILFREMEAIILATPWLDERCNVRRFTKDIEDERNGSLYAALSSDAPTKHGMSASFFVFDELAQSPNAELWDVLKTSGGARLEPLRLVISTQSADPLHVMSELLDYGRKVAAGDLPDTSFYSRLWAVPEPEDENDFDPFDEALWPLANPALGDFRSLEDMRSEAMQCRETPSRTPTFRNLYLNMRDRSDAAPWIDLQYWRACGKANVDPESLRGRKCYGGLDLSATRDLTALGLFFPDDAGGGDVLVTAWCPKDALRRRSDVDRVPYPLWAKSGLITPTPGASVDMRHIALHLAEVKRLYKLETIAYDRWRIEELKRILAEEGIDLPLVEHGVGFKDMSPSMKATEIMIVAGRLRHGRNALLSWAVSNVVVDVDPAENVKPSKRRARERIDPAVAMIMAVGIASRTPEKKVFKFKREMFSS